jgi:hypothetical protein
VTTRIVVATRSGLAVGPDGSKYRLARGRTLADARHPLAAAYPEMFAEYAIELPYEGDEPSSPAAGDGNLAQGEATAGLVADLADARAAADSYRAQLAAIAEDLYGRGLVPADVDTEREGWLAELIANILDRSRVEDPVAKGDAPEAPTVEPGPLPRPRKRAARPRVTE